MKAFAGKVAVITGGASGIGRAVAERCATEGMRVVLADIEEGPLAQAAQELAAGGADVLAVRTDVSRHEDVAALAEQTVKAFGGVHLLFNNAGVAAGGSAWESTLADWEWVIGVNVWGVIHGIRNFVPIMLAQEGESHIVNTASVAGLVPDLTTTPYLMSKYAVVGLSEQLYHSLARKAPQIGVSVLCPGWVNTKILASARNRPAELQETVAMTPEREAGIRETQRLLATGMAPAQIADHVFNAIYEKQLYILTHPEFNQVIRERMEAILASSPVAESGPANELFSAD